MASPSQPTAPASGPPANPREQGLAAIHRYFEVSLFFLITTGVITLVSTGKLDPVSTLLPPLALAIKAIRYIRGKGPELSHRAATWLTALYFLVFPFDLFLVSRTMASDSPNPLLYAALLAAIHLMLFALVVRLFSAFTTRDHLFLTMLAFALMLTAAILTVDTMYFGLFLLFSMLAVSTFVGLEMRRSAEGSVVPPMAAGTPTARRLQKALGATSALVAIGALTLGAGIFLIIPRVTAGYLSGLNLQPSLISGFSDDVELGQIGVIKKNKAVVMRVRVKGDPAQAQGVKWRGIALTTFDGRRWFRDEQKELVTNPSNQGWYQVGWLFSDITREQIQQRYQQGSRMNRREIYRPMSYTVLLEPLATDTLFLAAVGTSLRGRFAPEIVRAGRRGDSYLNVDEAGSVSNPFHNIQRILYEAQSMVPAVPPALLRSHQIGYNEQVKQRYLQLPPLDPRIPELAQRITANAPTAYDKAAAIEQYLRTRYGYTLDLSGSPPADPLTHFLFERRAGHCEYFAAAMTVMLRTLGIPARYVNGFLTGEYNDVGGDYIVRASDAHSWVEVFFGEYGWITFDPTPPAADVPTTWLGRLMHYYDWFELVWSEWVVNYDLNRQVTLAQNFQRASREWSNRWRGYFQDKRRAILDTIKGWHIGVSQHPSSLLGPAAALAFVLLLFRGPALRRFLAGQWGLHFGRDELTPQVATLLYRQMLKLLARSGFAKSPGQTPLEFAASIPGAELAGPVGQLTELYQSARFGARGADASQMTALLASLKDLLRAHPS